MPTAPTPFSKGGRSSLRAWATNSNFRLLFVASTRYQPDATDIAIYNTFVQNRSKTGYEAISDSFKVMGSSNAVDARANTDTEASDTDVAIYWLNGVKVAHDYADFYDGSWDNTHSNGKPDKDEYGRTSRYLYPFVAIGSKQRK